MISLLLPAPPSPNAIWRAFKQRVIRSREYRSWIHTAGLMAMAQRQRPLAGPVSIHLICGHNKRRDLDGYAKAVIDLLVSLHLIESDRWATVKHLSMDWDQVEGVQVLVTSLAQSA